MAYSFIRHILKVLKELADDGGIDKGALQNIADNQQVSRGNLLARERLKEMGFDVDTPQYTGFVGEEELDELSALDAHTWFSDDPSVASEYAATARPGSIYDYKRGVVVPAYVRGNFADLEHDDVVDKLFDALRDEMPGDSSKYLSDEEAIDYVIEKLGYDGVRTPDEAKLIIDRGLMESHLRGGRLWDAEGLGNRRFESAVLDELAALGYDGVRIPDATFGTSNVSTVVFDPENIRSIFDPVRKEIDTGYRGQHQPPSPGEDVARLDDMTGGGAVFPDDIYSSQGLRYYGSGHDVADTESFNVINAVRNDPEAEVTIYRAVPSNIEAINTGDFVTLSKTYAEDHAESGYGPSGSDAGTVISKKVKVKDVFSAGNDLNEFGYFPSAE